jgi:hypothetical protein
MMMMMTTSTSVAWVIIYPQADSKGFWPWCITLGSTGLFFFFFTLSIVRYSIKPEYTIFSKIGSVFVLRYRGRSVAHWLRLALFKCLNRVGIPPLLPIWGRKQIQFPKSYVLCFFKNKGRWTTSKNPAILSIIKLFVVTPGKRWDSTSKWAINASLHVF